MPQTATLSARTEALRGRGGDSMGIQFTHARSIVGDTGLLSEIGQAWLTLQESGSLQDRPQAVSSGCDLYADVQACCAEHGSTDTSLSLYITHDCALCA